MPETVASLRRQGYADAAIIAAFESARPRESVFARGAPPPPPLVRRPPAALRRLETPRAEIYTLDDFMPAAQCASLIELIDANLRPSELGDRKDYDDFRTSRTANIGHLDHPVALAADDLICRTLGLRAEFSEGIQGQRYDVGQQFRPHFDAFQPGSESFNRFASVRGNRTWTFMVYLNDVAGGGATRFTELDLAVTPKAGRALFWNNLNADGTPNLATKHAGEPVTAGHKVVITKWFRVMGHGAPFHDGA
jgi:prolyl 4-hydroxylase